MVSVTTDPAAPPAGGGTEAEGAAVDEDGRRPYRPTVATVTGAAFAVWGLLIGIQPLHDNSFLTHLATGRLILRTGHIPTRDPYSFTAPGRPWVVQSWLASIAYAGAEKLDGLGGIRILQGLLVAALATLVWHLTRPATTLIPRVVVAAGACAAGIGLWVERPLLVGLICLCLLMAVVDGRRDLRWLLPIMWVWVNTHGSFPLGLGLLVLLAIGRRLDGAAPARELHALGWAVAGTALGAVNPLGPRLLAFPLTLVQKTSSFHVIKEWRPPAWDSPWQLLFAAQLLVAVLLLARSRSWRAALPLVVFAGLALTSARNIVPASLVLVPGMAAGAHGLGSIDGHRRPKAGRAVLATVVVVGLLLAASSLRGPDAVLAAYPEQAVSWLDANHLLDHRLVAPDYVGNYLEARFHGRVQVFIDDRVDMYPARFVQDSSVLLHAGPGWPAVLARARAGVVLWPKADPLEPALRASRGWRVAWQDARWTVFLPVEHVS